MQGPLPHPRRISGCALAVLAAALVSACGGEDRAAPTPRDVAVVARSLSDVVFQCQAVAAGIADGVDAAALRRDVDDLLATWERAEPDAEFRLQAASGARATTLRKEVERARRNLAVDGCAPSEAKRLGGVLDDD